MAHLNPLNPQANPAGNGNAPNPNPNPHSAPVAAPRPANNQGQPEGLVEAPIAKRKAGQPKSQAKRQKTVAAPAADKQKQVRQPKNPKISAPKRQKTSVNVENIKTTLDLRHRLLLIQKSRAVSAKKVAALKPGIRHAEDKLRQYINGVVINAKTGDTWNQKPIEGNSILATCALTILKNPKDPDYVNAFLYLILKHPEKADEATHELNKFLDATDAGLRARQEEVRYALTKVSLNSQKRSHLSTFPQERIFPEERIALFTKRDFLSPLFRILEQDDFEHPLYDKMVRFLMAYWDSEFHKTLRHPELKDFDFNELTQYIENLGTSHWVAPLELLKKVEKVITDCVMDKESTKYSLALEMMMRYSTLNPARRFYQADYINLQLPIFSRKFFIISKESAKFAIEQAVAFLKDRATLSRSGYNVLNLLTYMYHYMPKDQNLEHYGIKEIMLRYCGNVTATILNNIEEIVEQAQSGKTHRLYKQYEKAFNWVMVLDEITDIGRLKEFLDKTQIDKNDFLMRHIRERNHFVNIEERLTYYSILWETILSKWALDDFQNFWRQIQTVIILKDSRDVSRTAVQTIIFDSIFLYANQEICLAFKDEFMKHYYHRGAQYKNGTFQSMANGSDIVQQQFASALRRLYDFEFFTAEYFSRDKRLCYLVESLKPEIRDAMPAVFRLRQQAAPQVLQVQAAPAPQPPQVPAPVGQLIAPPTRHGGVTLITRFGIGLQLSTQSRNIGNISTAFQQMKKDLNELYGGRRENWPAKIREDLEAFKADFMASADEMMPLRNEYCIELTRVLKERAQGYEKMLDPLLTGMHDNRVRHDYAGTQYDEIIKTLDLIITSIDDEHVKKIAQFTKLSFEDPLDVSGQQISLLEEHIELLRCNWQPYDPSSKEEVTKLVRKIVPYVMFYMASITSVSRSNQDIIDFISTTVQTLCESTVSLYPTYGKTLRLLQSYIDLHKAQIAEPASARVLFEAVCKRLSRNYTYLETADCIDFVTYHTILLDNPPEASTSGHKEYLTFISATIQRSWASIPWIVQMNILRSGLNLSEADGKVTQEIARFMFQIYQPYLQRKETPHQLLDLPLKLNLVAPNLHDKVPKGGNYLERIAFDLAQLYDQFPFGYKIVYTQNYFRGSAPELREKMLHFIADEFENPLLSATIEHVLQLVPALNRYLLSPKEYLMMLHRILDRLAKTDIIKSSMPLSALREAAKVTIPAVTFDVHEIPQHFQDLFDALNMTDQSQPDFISIPSVLGMGDLEFERSTYKDITRDKMRATCMRFLKDLVNRNLPVDRRLALSVNEIGANEPQLPALVLDAEWMQMISIMMTKIKETDNLEQRIHNTAILINALFICPTGQAFSLETVYGVIVLSREFSSRSFQEVIFSLIQKSQETALMRALGIPDSRVGTVLGQNVHHDQIYRLVLKTTYGLRKITSFEETDTRITSWADIEKILRFFRMQWTDDMIIESIEKAFGSKEDCEIVHKLGLTDQVAALKANRLAQQERPLRILDSEPGNSYLGWIMQNNLDPEEYGLTLAKDADGEIDLYNFKIEKIDITKEIVMKILRQMGYWTAIRADANEAKPLY